jgi:hypothetical protein
MKLISTGNTKTGPAFSIPEGVTCPGKTKTCAAMCYVQTGRMALPANKGYRKDRLSAVLKMVNDGTFLDNMTKEIKKLKLKTLRIHDSGDFFSPMYAHDWGMTIWNNPDVKFWAYTRSFTVPGIMAELVRWAGLANFSLWLSADKDNWTEAVRLFKEYEHVIAGIAFMETPGTSGIAHMIQDQIGPARYVNFPVHGHFGKVGISMDNELANCPAITRAIPHDKKTPACLSCLKCLPA